MELTSFKLRSVKITVAELYPKIKFFLIFFCGVLQLSKGTRLVKFGTPVVCDVKNVAKD